MRPACCKCNKEMEQTRTGVHVGLVVGSSPAEASLYQVWSGDEFTCHDCGAQVICRYGQRAFWNRGSGEEAPKVDVMVLAK